MLKLDHLVIHLDNDKKTIEDIKKKAEPLGYPLKPSTGPVKQGYSTCNMWIGDQYMNFAQLEESGIKGWHQDWIERYGDGKRGVFSLVISTDNLDEVYQGLEDRGIDLSQSNGSKPGDKTSKDFLEVVSDFLGLGQQKNKKTPHWRCFYLPVIPGTDLDISFLEYNPETEEEFREQMKPNSRDYGITGIRRSKIYLPLWDEGLEYLEKVFPQLAQDTPQKKVELGNSELIFFRSDPEDGLHLKVETTSTEKKTGWKEVQGRKS